MYNLLGLVITFLKHIITLIVTREISMPGVILMGKIQTGILKKAWSHSSCFYDEFCFGDIPSFAFTHSSPNLSPPVVETVLWYGIIRNFTYPDDIVKKISGQTKMLVQALMS